LTVPPLKKKLQSHFEEAAKLRKARGHPKCWLCQAGPEVLAEVTKRWRQGVTPAEIAVVLRMVGGLNRIPGEAAIRAHFRNRHHEGL
jgi:hypothetical protein